jgi:hypothetical protein
MVMTVLAGWNAVFFAALVAVGPASAQDAATAGRQAETKVVAPKWDRVSNIKEMAVHIGNVQRSQGAQRAMAFIDACYRTHSLRSTYNKPFEGCIAADYMLAQALVAVTQRVPPEQLQKTGMAPPAEILKAAMIRIGSGFGQYGIGTTDGQAFLRLVNEHGMLMFMQSVFPGAAAKAQDKTSVETAPPEKLPEKK